MSEGESIGFEIRPRTVILNCMNYQIGKKQIYFSYVFMCILWFNYSMTTQRLLKNSMLV